MADSELGELRRPPRPIEHRIERLARWRAQGLAGGASDSPFPVDFVDGSAIAGASEDGATGGAVPEWFFETFSVTSGSASTVTLTYVPIIYSEVVRLNGVTLALNVDYTISEEVLTFVDLTTLRLGIGSDTWALDIHYAYTETAIVPFEPGDFLTWTLNGDATIVGGTEVQLTPATASKKGSMVCPTVIPSGWDTITVALSLYVQPTVQGDGWEVILWDAAQHGTGELDVNGETYFGAQVIQTTAATNQQLFLSNDGATTINNSSSNSETVFGEYDYTLVWSKTGASTASVQFYRSGVLYKSSPSDIWVPSTVYLGICAYTGGLFYNEHTVRALTVDVT